MFFCENWSGFFKNIREQKAWKTGNMVEKSKIKLDLENKNLPSLTELFLKRKMDTFFSFLMCKDDRDKPQFIYS